MKYTVTRTDRRTTAIYIRPDGTVEVRTSHMMPQKRIEQLVAEKQAWIEQGILKAEADALANEVMDKLYYLGKAYPIHDFSGVPYFDGSGCYFPIDTRKWCIREILRRLAHEYIPKRVEELANKYGFTYLSVKINSACGRYGSCSGKGNLNFTKYLVMYEPKYIDYVILHELCHTVHHNHSKAFYEELERVLPQHAGICKELKKIPFWGRQLEK